MVTIYIETYNGYKALDNTEEISYAITKQFEYISNPSVIINDWSKTVNIPFSQNNNNIFTDLFHPDRQILSNSQFSFDPTQKVNFYLEGDSGELLFKGYMKFIQATTEGDSGYYEVTLNSEINNIFYELSSFTFDDTKYSDEEDKAKYYIDGSKYYDERMNRQLIYDSWNNEIDTSASILKSDSDYKAYNVVGWTPLNCRYDSDTFNEKSYQKSDTEIVDIKDIFPSEWESKTGISIDTIIGDGLLPRTFGEFRSYLQQPFVTIPTLFKIMQAQLKNTQFADWNIIGDKRWFKKSNSYYNDVVLLLNGYGSETESYVNNYYNSASTKTTDEGYAKDRFESFTVKYESEQEALPTKVDNYNDRWNLPYFAKINNNYDIKIDLSLKASLINFNKFVQNYLSNFYCIFCPYTQVGISTKSTKYLFLYAPTVDDAVLTKWKKRQAELGRNGQWVPIVWTGKFSASGYSHIIGTVNHSISHFFEKSDDELILSIQRIWSGETTAIEALDDVNEETTVTLNTELTYYNFYKRTNGEYTLNNLWNNEQTPFEVLLRYCKLFNLCYKIDNATKTLTILPKSSFFKDGKVIDWTDKVDHSQSFVVKPIDTEYKYFKYNYEDNDSYVNALYKNQYGVNFGELNVNTNYQFNSESNNLFEKILCPIESTDTVYLWQKLCEYVCTAYVLNESYICPKDEDGKYLADNFGTFYFYNGIQPFDETVDGERNIISDDSELQMVQGSYCYSHIDATLTDNYAELSPLKDSNMITYTTPTRTFSTNKYDNTVGLYENFWQPVIEEKYNKNTKQITCYVNLTTKDWNDFSFNNFVQIDNQLCVVNKIYDYSLTDNALTKVDLITVNDIDAYKRNNYMDYIFTVSPESLSIPYKGGSVDFDLNTNKDIKVRAVGSKAYIDRQFVAGSQYAKLDTGKHTLKGTWDLPLKSFNLKFIGGNTIVTVPVTLVSTETLTLSKNYVDVAQGNTTSVTISGNNYWNLEYVGGPTLTPLISFDKKSGKGADVSVVTFEVDSTCEVGEYEYKVTTTGYYGEVIEKSVFINVVDSYIKVYGGEISGGEAIYQVDMTDTWTLESSSDWTWKDQDSRLQGFEINGTDGSGSGTAGKTTLSITVGDIQGASGQIIFTNKEGKTVMVLIEVK
jgi:hypothetical protein